MTPTPEQAQAALEEIDLFLNDIGRAACIEGWFDNNRETIIAALEAVCEDGWRPISEAPKNKHVLITNGDWVDEGYWHFEKEFYDEWREKNNHPTDHWGDQLYPTHWMPLPPAPEGQSDE